MERGTVSRYFNDKRYGFVDDGRGGSLFFHVNNRVWGKGEPSPGEPLFFERGVDRQGRPCVEHWVAACAVTGLVEIHGCFLAPDVLVRYPFLSSILEAHSKTTQDWGIYPVSAKSLTLELPALKAWRPDDHIDKLSDRYTYVYVIARGKQPVALQKGLFFYDDVIQPGPLVSKELARLGYRDSDITAIVRIETDRKRDERLHSVTIYL